MVTKMMSKSAKTNLIGVVCHLFFFFLKPVAFFELRGDFFQHFWKKQSFVVRLVIWICLLYIALKERLRCYAALSQGQFEFCLLFFGSAALFFLCSCASNFIFSEGVQLFSYDFYYFAFVVQRLKSKFGVLDPEQFCKLNHVGVLVTFEKVRWTNACFEKTALSRMCILC